MLDGQVSIAEMTRVNLAEDSDVRARRRAALDERVVIARRNVPMVKRLRESEKARLTSAFSKARTSIGFRPDFDGALERTFATAVPHELPSAVDRSQARAIQQARSCHDARLRGACCGTVRSLVSRRESARAQRS
jgi:hypothetical protein